MTIARHDALTPLVLVAIWASLLIIFMFARPSPTSPLSWLLNGSAMVVSFRYVQHSNRESGETQQATGA